MDLDTTRVLSVADKFRQVCDNCKLLKKRCDRALPKCSNCVKRKIDCTRHIKLQQTTDSARQSIKLKYAQSMTIIGKHCKQKGINNESRVNSSPSLSFNKPFLILKDDIKTFKATIFNINTSQLSIYPFKLFHIDEFFDKAFSHIYQSNPELRVYLALKSYDKFQSRKKLCKKIDDYHYDPFNDNNHLIYEAIDAYFKYINLEVPLFTYYGFMTYKREMILQCAVILSGLSLLKETDSTNQLAKFIKNSLMKELKPSKIKLSLSYIQTLIVLKHGLRAHTYALPSYFYSDLISKCLSIGLHLKSPFKIGFNTIFERKLAFSAAIYLDTNSNMLTMDPDLDYISDILSNANNKYETIINNERNENINNEANNEDDWEEMLNLESINELRDGYFIKNYLIIAKYRINLSKYLRETYILLNKVSKLELKASQVYTEAKQLFDLINSITHKSMIKLYELEVTFKINQQIKEYNDIQIKLILIESNTVIMNSYENMSRAKLCPPDTLFINKPVLENVNEKELSCLINYGKRIISYNKSLGFEPYASTRIIGLIYCLRTIQVYISIHEEGIQVIKDGFSFLEGLKKVPNYTWVIDATMDLTKVVVEIESTNK
ncbi:hypothetical protein K502DRAFT_348363 [Neoconidiobolus thromboides FSU 785]|nr:hypothetical protein K502DRAFT_348363 [Neoconidiobolus thromboides FSU 785]